MKKDHDKLIQEKKTIIRAELVLLLGNRFHNYMNDVEYRKVFDILESFLIEKVEEAEKKTAEDICCLLNEIELKDQNTSMEQWKQYKRIRNTIRAQYVINSQNHDKNK